MSTNAPGSPGIEPRWTSSAKSGVGTALNSASKVWFTLSHGILNEVYYPRIDQACLRDFQILVSDGQSKFWEEKRDLISKEEYLSNGTPAFQIKNSEPNGRFEIHKEIICDPKRDVLLQRIRFVSEKSDPFETYALLAPHLGNQGWG